MSFIVKCLIAAILGTVGYVFAAAVTVNTLWKALLVLIGLFFACQVLCVLVIFIASFFVEQKPIEKQSVFFRYARDIIADIIVFYMMVRTKIIGKEKIPLDSRFLFVCNHRSGFDPMIVMAKLKQFNISFISKPENVKLLMVGNVAWAAGALSLDRDNDREALKTILQAADYMKRDLCSIAIYPEGTRSKTGELLPFHAGSFKIAQRANVPVVVACVSGTEKVKDNIFRRRTRTTMKILDVIPAEKVREMKTNELADYSRTLIQEGLDNE